MAFGVGRPVRRDALLIAGLHLVHPVPDLEKIVLSGGLLRIGKALLPHFPRTDDDGIPVIGQTPFHAGIQVGIVHRKMLFDDGIDFRLRQVIKAVIPVQRLQLGALGGLPAVQGGKFQIIPALIAVQLVACILQQQNGIQPFDVVPVDAVAHRRQRRNIFPAHRIHIGKVDAVCLAGVAAGGTRHQRAGDPGRQQQRQKRRRSPAFFGHIKNSGKTVFQRLFAAVKVGGKQGGGVHAHPDDRQQAAPVFLPVALVPSGHHRLIAGKLQVTVGGPDHQPHHRVEPVDGIGQHQ